MTQQPASTQFEPELPPIEMRRIARRRVYFPAKLVHGHGAFSTDCTIRNISEKGAGLSVPEGMHVPQKFYLIDIRKGEIHEASPVSSRNGTLGVKFSRTYAHDEPLDADLDYLRRLRTSLVP